MRARSITMVQWSVTSFPLYPLNGILIAWSPWQENQITARFLPLVTSTGMPGMLRTQTVFRLLSKQFSEDGTNNILGSTWFKLLKVQLHGPQMSIYASPREGQWSVNCWHNKCYTTDAKRRKQTNDGPGERVPLKHITEDSPMNSTHIGELYQ